MSALTGEEDVCPLVSSGIGPSETSLLVQEVLLDLVSVTSVPGRDLWNFSRIFTFVFLC